MAQPNQVNLLIDIDHGRLLNAFTSARSVTPPRFTFGDSVPLTVRFLRATSEESTADQPYSDIDLTHLAARVALGAPGGDPSSGTWKLTFDGNTTSNLAYNATASNVQAEVNKLTTVQNSGNVIVTRPATGLYRLVWNTNGNRNLVTSDTASLYPTSEPQIYQATNGNASVREVQIVHIETKPAAYIELTTALPSAAVSISSLRHGNSTTNISEIQEIDFTAPEPYEGSWTASTNSGAATHPSEPIPWNASPDSLQSALQNTNTTAFSNKITVTGGFPIYTVEFDDSLGNVALLTGDVSALKVPKGFQGNLDTNTAGFRELLAGKATAEATLEVEARNTTASTSWTPLQTPCLIREDLISGTPASAGPQAKDYVDLSTTQTVGGDKTFTGEPTFTNEVSLTGTAGSGKRFIVAAAVANVVLGAAHSELSSPIVTLPALPTSDPGNTGQLWNDSGTVKVSA